MPLLQALVYSINSLVLVFVLPNTIPIPSIYAKPAITLVTPVMVLKKLIASPATEALAFLSWCQQIILATQYVLQEIMWLLIIPHALHVIRLAIGAEAP